MVKQGRLVLNVLKTSCKETRQVSVLAATIQAEIRSGLRPVAVPRPRY